MVVGNDEIDAATACGFGSGEGANACVNADDEAAAGSRGLLDNLVTHAIAFADTVRDVILNEAAAEFQSGLQDDDGSGAVHIVVAINEDGFLPFDGRSEAIDGGAQARHEVRRVEPGKRWVQKAVSVFGCNDATGGEGKGFDDSWIGRALQPAHLTFFVLVGAVNGHGAEVFDEIE